MQALLPHQERAIALLDEGVRAVLLRYGSGKTRVALEFAKRNGVHPVILCKKRNIITWQIELAKWWPELGVYPYTGNVEARRWNLDRWDANGGALLMPWPLLYRDLPMIGDELHSATTFIADESTTIKNYKANVTEAALALASKYTMVPRLVLTGNIAPESLTETWAQFQFAYGPSNPLGSTAYRFLNRWFIHHDRGWTVRLDKEAELYRLLRIHSVWLSESEIADLMSRAGIPRNRYVVEYYEPTARQKSLLADLYGQWCIHDSMTGGRIDFEYTMQVMEKAQQVSSGFYYRDDDEPEVFDCPKLMLLNDTVNDLMAEEPARKIVVWHRYREELPMLLNCLARHGAVAGPDGDRVLSFHRHDGIHIIIMPLACSEGFNELAVASTNIFYSNLFSQEKRDQAEARISRIGSAHDVSTHIDLAGVGQRDMEVITALQSKSLTPERLNTIVRKARSDYAVNLSTGQHYVKTSSNNSHPL